MKNGNKNLKRKINELKICFNIFILKKLYLKVSCWRQIKKSKYVPFQ